jgi:FPC/CPF motif-containing protein YcgG
VRIFVSYRRADVGGHAGRLSDTLVHRLGAKSVFQDVTAIAAGRDFASAIREALDACDGRCPEPTHLAGYVAPH